MPKLPDSNPIDILVAHKFPRPAFSFGRNVGGSVGWISTGDWSEEQHPQYGQIKKYRAALAKKTLQEIEEMCEAAHREREAQIERKRFFNHPRANADFEYWAKAAYWTLEEAIVLSFGKDPKVVTEDRILRSSSRGLVFYNSPFVIEYQKRTDLMRRAEEWGDLEDPVAPSVFVSWAKKNDIKIPQMLEEQVELRHEAIVDWKKAYDEFLEKHNKYIDTVSRLLKHKDEEIEKLHALLALNDEQKKIENKPVHAKERDTFLKIIIAMAIEGYSYDPEAKKSPIPQEICDDLVKLEIPLDPDTVRAKIKEAAELLPQQTEIKTAKPKSGNALCKTAKHNFVLY